MHASRLFFGLTSFLACGVAFATLASPGPSQEGPQPTEQHAILQKGVGHWSGTITMHDAASPEPTTSACSEVISPIGDLWTTSHFVSEFMGMPFTGSSTMGYDPEKKKFVGTWIDSATAALTIMEGDWNADKKAIVMRYETKDMSGAMQKIRSETTYSGETSTARYFDVTSGTDQISMEITMKRSNKPAEAGAER